MDWFVKAFLKASLAWLGAGVWLANGGLALFVAGLVMLPHTAFGTPARVVVAIRHTVDGRPSGRRLAVFFYTMWSRIRPLGSQAREAQGERF